MKEEFEKKITELDVSRVESSRRVGKYSQTSRSLEKTYRTFTTI